MLDEKTNTTNTDQLTKNKSLSDVEKKAADKKNLPVKNADATKDNINDKELSANSEELVSSTESKATESKATESKAAESKTVESKTVESKTAESKTDKSKTTKSKVSEPSTEDALTNKIKAAEQIDLKKKEVKKQELGSNAIEKYDLEELVEAFEQLLKEGSIPSVKKPIDQIKLNFNQKFGDLLRLKKKAFLDDGGNEIDFQYSNPIKTRFNDLLFEYKTKREQYYSELEKEQKENLSKRLALIEELKALIDTAEPSTMYQLFRDLQGRWNKIGKIPRSKYNDVWRTYHHHVERFYDLLHLSNDFRDLDFKHNLEEKLKLVERAEALTENTDLSYAFKELQVLHRMWKEEIGPVAREFREEIWGRFSSATKKIHEKRHEFQKELESKFEENVDKKRAVIEQISNLVNPTTVQSHKLWQQKIKELELLRQEFFKIGKVPRALNEKIWKEFKEVTRNFNRLKNNFYKNIKREQHENLQKKNALVEKAESLKDSTDYDTTTEIMKQIQAEWRTIGHVPRKYSDKIWKQFKDACNHYFDRLHNVQDEANKDQVDAFNQKKELLDKIKSQASSKEGISIELINSYLENWKKLGALPSKMRHLDVKFNKTLDGLYSKLNLSTEEISLLKFKNNIDIYLAQNNLRKIDSEQLFIRKKIDEIVRETQQLENNISFISSDDDNNPLLINVRNNIANYNQQLKLWKNKLDYLSNLDY